ncbi:Cell division cycle 5-like protein [Hordeum vulgare]|nr:Cell division cycle 5-like protein [Hordeum vulgare]
MNRAAGAPLSSSAELLHRLPRIRQSTMDGEPPPEMELSLCERFLLENSSDSDDSDVETMLLTFCKQSLVMALAVKEHKDENQKRRRGSTVDRLCIPQNCHLGNEMLMQDHFAANPTYLPHLFWRRYRRRISLFVKIVQPCEANCRYVTQRRNVVGLKGFSAYQKILQLCV